MITFTATAQPEDIDIYGRGCIRITDAEGEIDVLGYRPGVDDRNDAGIVEALAAAGWAISGDWDGDMVQVTASGAAAARLAALGIA